MNICFLFKDKCAWSLGNLAGDCAELRDAVVQLGALKPLVALLKVNLREKNHNVEIESKTTLFY